MFAKEGHIIDNDESVTLAFDVVYDSLEYDCSAISLTMVSYVSTA